MAKKFTKLTGQWKVQEFTAEMDGEIDSIGLSQTKFRIYDLQKRCFLKPPIVKTGKKYIALIGDRIQSKKESFKVIKSYLKHLEVENRKKNGRLFVIGDIHGAYKALKQCLDKSNFDYEKDILVCLGDIADGWPEVPECIEELLKIKNLLLVIGNHDDWLDKWFKLGQRPPEWEMQGGKATIDAYLAKPKLMIKHRDFFNRACQYVVDNSNRMYVHGGFQRGVDLKSQTQTMLMWDRTLATKAAGSKKGKNALNVQEFKEVYLGHTTVNYFKKLPKNKPHQGGNVWLMDTGAGWEGVLTIMDVDTKEYWQSDIVASLYPETIGRNGKKFNSGT